ncbi:MAG: hypothetical protein Q9226_008217, partial [Calogaya cf. arnoldii]
TLFLTRPKQAILYDYLQRTVLATGLTSSPLRSLDWRPPSISSTSISALSSGFATSFRYSRLHEAIILG